jgi:hypothetical protein
MDRHRHDENGDVVLVEDTTPSDAEVEARAITHAAEAQAGADVEIARVQADAAVQLAKIERSTLDDEERIELEALREQVRALEAMNAPPEPEPVPVVINDADVEAEPDMAPPADDDGREHAPKRKVGLGMW